MIQTPLRVPAARAEPSGEVGSLTARLSDGYHQRHQTNMGEAKPGFSHGALRDHHGVATLQEDVLFRSFPGQDSIVIHRDSLLLHSVLSEDNHVRRMRVGSETA